MTKWVSPTHALPQMPRAANNFEGDLHAHHGIIAENQHPRDGDQQKQKQLPTLANALSQACLAGAYKVVPRCYAKFTPHFCRMNRHGYRMKGFPPPSRAEGILRGCANRWFVKDQFTRSQAALRDGEHGAQAHGLHVGLEGIPFGVDIHLAEHHCGSCTRAHRCQCRFPRCRSMACSSAV